MNKPVFLLDIDDTLNDFSTSFIKEVERQGYKFDYKHYNDWDIARFIIGVEDPDKLMSDICEKLSFWKSLNPVPYAYDVLKEVINDQFDIILVTSPWIENSKHRKVKSEWIKNNFGFLRKKPIIFSKEKWSIAGPIIMDDKPKTLKSCYICKITIKPMHPYNKNVLSNYEFKSWKEVPGIIKSLKKDYHDYLFGDDGRD